MKNKTTAKHFEPLVVYEPILYTTTWFYCGCPLEEALKDVEARNNVKINLGKPDGTRDMVDLGSSFVVRLDEADLYVIYVRRKRDIETLSHEIVHNVFKIFSNLGIPISDENQEIFARYHSYFMRELKKGLR